MHMADALLSPAVGAAMWAVSAGLLAYSSSRLKSSLDDRRVPLIFWGPWKGGERREPVRTIDLAPTLAQELGLKAGMVDGKALDLGATR